MLTDGDDEGRSTNPVTLEGDETTEDRIYASSDSDLDQPFGPGEDD